ncbi:Lrp/AsnC family transcriptional regulator [Stetteria hydrogenophila]
MHAMRLDEKDVEILKILFEDARIPWRRLARMMNVSETTVYLRVKNLIEKGVIKGFRVEVSPEKMGLNVSAYILLSIEAPYLKEAREQLKRSIGVYEAFEISGDYQFIVKAYAPDQEKLMRIVDEMSTMPGVKDIKVMMVLRKVKDGSGIIDLALKWMEAKEDGKKG